MRVIKQLSDTSRFVDEHLSLTKWQLWSLMVRWLTLRCAIFFWFSWSPENVSQQSQQRKHRESDLALFCFLRSSNCSLPVSEVPKKINFESITSPNLSFNGHELVWARLTVCTECEASLEQTMKVTFRAVSDELIVCSKQTLMIFRLMSQLTKSHNRKLFYLKVPSILSFCAYQRLILIYVSTFCKNSRW